jgi:hypothetical protein
LTDYSAMLGAVPSPFDVRDRKIAELELPESEEYPATFFSGPVPPVLHQQGGTCVGHSSTTMRAQQEKKQKGVWFDLDPYALYDACKAIDGIPGEGTYVRSAMSVLKNKGQPVRGGHEWDSHRIKAYYAIPHSERDLKNAIYTLGAVVVAGPWYTRWFNPTKLSGYTLGTPDHEEGGHAFALTGWSDNRGFLLHNSWGREWASLGRAYYPYKYVSRLWEAWKAIDA